MAQGVKQFKKAGKFEIRRLLFTLILILCPPKSIKISLQIYQISIALYHFRMLIAPIPTHVQHGPERPRLPHGRHASAQQNLVTVRGLNGGFTSREINGKRHGAPPATVRSTLPRDPSLTESSRPQLLCGCCVVGR